MQKLTLSAGWVRDDNVDHFVGAAWDFSTLTSEEQDELLQEIADLIRTKTLGKARELRSE